MTRAELTKIDLQELKMAYTSDVFQQPEMLRVTLTGTQLKALVDVVEKAVRMAKAADRFQDDDSDEAQIEFYEADKAFRAALTPFTESTNEEA